MRKPAPLPSRSAGRVSFLEGRAVTSVPFHVEDKLVQSSGPSGLTEEAWRELGDKLFDLDTPPQRQEAPPTLKTEKTATPPDKGTVSPLHIQLTLPFEPEMVEVTLPSSAALLTYDYADVESRVVAAMMVPGAPGELGEETWDWHMIYGNEDCRNRN